MNSFIYLRKNIKNLKLEENDVGIIVENIKSSNEYEIKFLRNNITTILPEGDIEIFDIKRTGDTEKFKVCDRCFKRLSTSTCFENNRIKKGGLITKRPSCRSCRKVKDGKKISTPDRKEWNLKKPKDYSPFTCPICTKTTIVGISKIVLDHCHKTGEVRGFLCESCNTGIGRFDDDPEIVTRAEEWLKN
ncbi:endonuclease VII domain-containing protein [Gammaproteobacteria bacterium]|nr:endonuclease VII domain-containing protein [Gammaproteobacteria bacterium]